MLTKIRACLLLAAIALFMIPAGVWAMGLGITPGKLDFAAAPGSAEVETLYVINNSEETSNFRVYADEGYVDWLQISPDEFTLEPELNEAVEITVMPPRKATGDYEFLLYVVSKSEGSNLDIGAGIKVPVSIHIGENIPGKVADKGDSSYPPYLISILIVNLALIILLIAIIVRRRKMANR